MATKIEKLAKKEQAIKTVLEKMRSGISTTKACGIAGITHSQFLVWVNGDEKLQSEYARAREDLIETIAQEILDLSDKDVGVTPDGRKDWAAIQKHRLQVDSRKWLLSKLAPKKYGDKLEISGDPERPLSIQKIERVIVDKT